MNVVSVDAFLMLDRRSLQGGTEGTFSESECCALNDEITHQPIRNSSY